MSKHIAFNPYLPSYEYLPDGEPHVFGDRVYIFGSHDAYNGFIFCPLDYICYSAPVDDLGNWRYEGVIYPRTADPLNRDGKMCLYAPDVTKGPDGRYYLYYCLDKVPIMSVAVADTPAGPYEFYGYIHDQEGRRLGEREGDEPQFDPAVLTEGDITYMYSGFCGRGDRSRTGSRVVILKSDMLTMRTEPKTVLPGSEYSSGTEFEGHAFFEASSIRKVNGKYYLAYSSELMHELCYAISDQPMDGFHYAGVLVSNTDLHIDSYKPAKMSMCFGANNHRGIENIGGKWYIFYHRHTNGTWYSRQGCAEELTLLEDGTFPQVEMTSCGLNGGPLPGIGEYPAYLACNLFTKKHSIYLDEENAIKIMQDGRDGDEEIGYIGNMKDGATAGFKYFDCKGVSRFSVTTRGYAGGTIEVRTAWDGDVLATLSIPFSNVWETETVDLKLEDGVYAFYLTYCGGGTAMLKSFTLA